MSSGYEQRTPMLQASERPRAIASRIKGRTSILRSLSLLVIRVLASARFAPALIAIAHGPADSSRISMLSLLAHASERR